MVSPRHVAKISSRPAFAWLGAAFVCSVILMENHWFGHQHFKSMTGVAMIDMNLFYSVSDVIGFLDRIGPAGRASYRVLLVLDFILIITLFLFSTAVLHRLLDANKLSSGYSWLMLIPLYRGLFDSMETGTMLIGASIYPEVLPELVGVAVLATPAKWLCFAVNGAVALALVSRICVRKLIISRSLA